MIGEIERRRRTRGCYTEFQRRRHGEAPRIILFPSVILSDAIVPVVVKKIFNCPAKRSRGMEKRSWRARRLLHGVFMEKARGSTEIFLIGERSWRTRGCYTEFLWRRHGEAYRIILFPSVILSDAVVPVVVKKNIQLSRRKKSRNGEEELEDTVLHRVFMEKARGSTELKNNITRFELGNTRVIRI